eukprot:Em0070g6a
MPTSQAAPNITALNAVTALSNTADPLNPSVPNGIITACNVRQRSTALWKQHAPQLDVRLVVLPMSQHWIVATVRFHAYNPSGILFYQINSVITDFLGVKMHGGLPWLIFDVGSGPAVVGSNSTRTFIDGQWHTGHVVLFEQASNTFYVTVDTVHAAAITDVIVPLLTMKVYFEGFPSTRADMALQPLTACVLSPPEWYLAPDGFDAVSVQNVGSTYIIVSWDLPTHSNGILINFSLYCNGALAGVLPLTVISYNTTGLLPFTFYMYITLSVGQVLQSRPQALHSSWNVVLGVISAAASLPRHKRFHTLFDLVKYGLMSKYNLEQDAGMGHLFPPSPQTGNPGSITEIGCTLLSGSAEQDALTMKQSPLKNLIQFFLRPHPSWG